MECEKENRPWNYEDSPWKTKAEFFTYLRGALRRAIWEKWPLKFKFKDGVVGPPPEDYKGKAKSGAYCALSGEWVPKSYAEVDHIVGNVSLQEWEDVLPFIQHLCCPKENMQYVSKEGHKVKSYADKQGITFEEAQAEKTAIALIRSKKDKEFLESMGEIPGSNQSKRRKQIVEHLLKESK